MAIDCNALQARYDALDAAYLALLQGKRVVSVTYGDQTTTYTQSRDQISALRDERDQVATALATYCSISVMGATQSRIAQPSMGSGR
jgi:hypothetical protein